MKQGHKNKMLMRELFFIIIIVKVIKQDQKNK